MKRSPTPIRLFTTLIFGIYLISQSGCTASPAVAMDQPASTIQPPDQTATPVAVSSTSLSYSDNSVQPELEIQGDTGALLYPPLEFEPLHFTFPTPVANYQSAWRPPLLPVPWALSPYDHFYFTRPIAADNVSWPSPDYRYGDLFPDSDIVHTGIDIAADRGTQVHAAAAGKVTWAGEGLYRGINSDEDPYGLAVAIRHDFGFDQREIYTIYAHMDRIGVQVGQYVETGETLGNVGSTGNATGPHLHFEVRIKENTFFTSRNPELWLAPPQGQGVLVGRLIDRFGQPIPHLNVKVTSIATHKTWPVRTYGPSSVNGDDYYRENLVLGDLPTGEYLIEFRVRWKDYRHMVSIQPGAVTFFDFTERPGVFSDRVPESNPSAIFKPVEDTGELPPVNP